MVFTAQLQVILRAREAYTRELLDSYSGKAHLDRVQKACEYIHRHFHEVGCTAKHVKEELGIHDHNFSSRFRNQTGMGLKEYITHHRINLAKRLLKHDGLAICQIALEAGYASHEAFTMAFRRLEGCTPSAFRQQCNEKT